MVRIGARDDIRIDDHEAAGPHEQPQQLSNERHAGGDGVGHDRLPKFVQVAQIRINAGESAKLLKRRR